MTCDMIHFEALGSEAAHLEAEINAAKARGSLPANVRSLITPDSVQDYLAKNPGARLPGIITTKTHSALPEEYLLGARKNIVTRSAGYDHFESIAARANIATLREYCVNAVAQSAIKLMHAAAGLLNQYTLNARTFERGGAASFMELCPARTATVFGAGKIGKRVYELLCGNGLTAWAVDIRRDELGARYGGGVRFVSGDEAARKSDIIICAMSLTRDPASRFYNMSYFSREYLKSCKKGLIFINVTRGELAPESALLELYDAGHIGGIGLDCYTDEAGFAAHLSGAPPRCPDHAAAAELVRRAQDRSANVYVQPHQAYNSDLAAAAKAREAVRHLEALYRNGGARFDEQLPYYV